MDPIRRFSHPELRRPKALVAFEGWSDACDAASGAAAYLLGQLDAEEPFAAIDPEEFFDFKDRRPIVEVDDGGTRSLSWPATRFYGIHQPDAEHDLVVVLGEEPNLRWRTFARLVAQLLDESGVEQAVTLGAFAGQVAHTVPVPVIGVATDPDLVARLGLLTTKYEGPTAIVSVVLEACRETGIQAVSLWAATPHYLAANANPKAMLALLREAERVVDIAFDTDEMETAADEFGERVAEAMGSSSDLANYVKRLEQGAWDGEFLDRGEDAGEQLIEDIEQYLRNQG